MYDRLIVGTSEDVEAFFLITHILSSVTTYYYTSESFLPTSLKLSHFCYLGFNSQHGQNISSLLQNVQTSSEAHPTSNWMVLWDLYLEDEADHSPPSDDEVNDWSYTFTPPLCHHIKYRDNNCLLVAHQITHKSCLTHNCPSSTHHSNNFIPEC
jgi:hypothetical protein